MKEIKQTIEKRCRNMADALNYMVFNPYHKNKRFAVYDAGIVNYCETLFVIKDIYTNGLYFVAADERDLDKVIDVVEDLIACGKSIKKYKEMNDNEC